MSIRLLDPEVVSKIAAGEVVERPASVVKELLENSIDAGSSRINVEVKGGGVGLIRVTDNGTGIAADEAELAFHRHATSKLSSLVDLENTTSLGFRGEALPSIAQIARVELLTRSDGQDTGTYLSLQDGRVEERGIKACPRGTTITVRGLFRNFPARLKFLKSTTTENGHITDQVSHYSLAFPDIRISLIVDGRNVLHTPGNGKVRDVLVEVYGLKTAQAVIELEESGKNDGLSPLVGGYIGPPSVNRANRSYLSFFVNRRWIHSPLMARAVEKAYEGLLMKGKFPVAVINLTLPPGWVDINVHPAKREVRFNQEPVIFNAVYGAVRRALSEQKPIPEFSSSPVNIFASRQSQSVTQWMVKDNPVTAPLIPQISPQGMPILRIIGQFANTYIVAEGPDGLYLIDQHAAHERILFEEITAQREKRKVEVQSLLEPLSIELDSIQEEIFKTKGEILIEYGFDIEPFGEKTILLRAVPSVLGGRKLEEAVKEIFDSLKEETPLSKMEEKIAISLACHNAVRAGKVLTHEEMKALVQQLEAAVLPRTCPHGRPTMIHLGTGRLEREFGRG